MPSVDPILKQDLTLVKTAFEAGALKQDGAATYLPFRTMISNTRQTHEAIQSSLKTYPSYYVPKSGKQNLIDKIQNECLPCITRLKSLGDLDVHPDIDLTLGKYDTTCLKGLTQFYSNLKGASEVETHICQMYGALKTQCIPDLQRMIQALTLLISDIRNIDLQTLKMSFLQLVVALLGKMVVSYTTGLDKYTRLITDTLRCMSYSIKDQLAKLDPILSQGGRANTAEAFQRASTNAAGQVTNPRDFQTTEAFRKAWVTNQSDQNWLQRDQQSSPVYNAYVFDKINKAEATSTDAVKKLDNAEVGFHTTAGNKDSGGGPNKAALVLDGILNMSIGRVEVNLEGALQDLIKLLKGNADGLEAMNAILQQIQSIIGLLNIVKALVSANPKQILDPCGPERGRAFFSQLSIPGRKIYVTPPPADSGRGMMDVDVIIANDPIQVDNPIVREVLQQAGINIRTITPVTKNVGSSTPNEANINFVVDSEPISINFFACMKRTLSV